MSRTRLALTVLFWCAAMVVVVGLFHFASAPAPTTQPEGGFLVRLWGHLLSQLPRSGELANTLAVTGYRLAMTVLAFTFAAAGAWVLVLAIRVGMGPLMRRSPAVRNRLETLRSLLVSVVRYAVFIATGLWVLGAVWGVDTSSLVVGSAVLGGAIGFGSQGLIQDVITGIGLLAENQLRVGDWVEISGKSGLIESVGLRAVRLRAPDGQVHIIFNRTIGLISSYSDAGTRAAVDVNLGDPGVAAAAREVLEGLGQTMAEQFEYVIGPPSVSPLVSPDRPERYIRMLFRVRPSEKTVFAGEVAQRITEALKVTEIPLGPHGVDVQFGPRAEPEGD